MFILSSKSFTLTLEKYKCKPFHRPKVIHLGKFLLFLLIFVTPMKCVGSARDAVHEAVYMMAVYWFFNFKCP